MGRKKKIEQVEEKIEEKVDNNSSLKYEGKVSFQLKVGNKLYGKPKVFKNEGWWPLFKYICRAIATDNPSVSESPRLIRVFSIGAYGGDVPQDRDDFNALVAKTTTERVSLIDYPYTGSVTYDPTSDSEAKDKYSVTFKFTIPFSSLNAFENLNMLAFYSTSKASLPGNNDASAYIIVTTKIGDREVLSDIIQDIGLDKALAEANKNQYNLFVTWKMTFKN